MAIIKNILGCRFGKLLVAGMAGKDAGRGEILWNCQCDCGESTIIPGGRLRSGGAKSCGCMRHQYQRTGGVTHTPEHQIWKGILKRCNDSNDRAFRHYGGRGILVCERWRGDDGFANFLADMGMRPQGSNKSGKRGKFEIDRKDTNGNYSPENCRWATRVEQMRNFRKNRRLLFRGVTACVSEWAEKLGITRGAIEFRLKRGWTVEDALTLPVDCSRSYSYRKEDSEHVYPSDKPVDTAAIAAVRRKPIPAEVGRSG